MHGWPKALFITGVVLVAIAGFCLVQLLLNPFRGPGDDVWTVTGIGVGVMGLLLMSTSTVMKRGQL
jgi:hypothetical protein